MNVLHDGPHDGQATGFGGEGVNLVRPLPDIAKETFNRIRTANVAMHDWRKSIKRQKMLFISTKTPYRFGITRSRYFALNAARLGSASSCFSCFQIPASSVATSCRSRWGMA